jgi:hypothetical protein
MKRGRKVEGFPEKKDGDHEEAPWSGWLWRLTMSKSEEDISKSPECGTSNAHVISQDEEKG